MPPADPLRGQETPQKRARASAHGRQHKYLARLPPCFGYFSFMSTAIQYLTDEAGEKTGVILSLADYERLTEDVQDLADIVDRRKEPTVAHDDFLAQLREDGRL